jgi:hypothetical protein
MKQTFCIGKTAGESGDSTRWGKRPRQCTKGTLPFRKQPMLTSLSCGQPAPTKWLPYLETHTHAWMLSGKLFWRDAFPQVWANKWTHKHIHICVPSCYFLGWSDCGVQKCVPMDRSMLHGTFSGGECRNFLHSDWTACHLVSKWAPSKSQFASKKNGPESYSHY